MVQRERLHARSGANQCCTVVFAAARLICGRVARAGCGTCSAFVCLSGCVSNAAWHCSCLAPFLSMLASACFCVHTRVLAAASARACGERNASQISYCITCLLPPQLLVCYQNAAHSPQRTSVDVLLQHWRKKNLPEVALSMGRISCQLYLWDHKIPSCLQDARVLTRVVGPTLPAKVHFALPNHAEGC